MTQSERAKKELELAGLFSEEDDFYGGNTGPAVMKLFEEFVDQGHSGMSASLVSTLFYELARGNVLTPLTGKPEEWEDVSKIMGCKCFQNKRMSSVFAGGSSGENPIFQEGIRFKRKDGLSFIAKESQIPITFPCIPKTKVIEEGTPEAEAYSEVFKR